jgi:uncharacterized membrane protein
MTPQQLSNELRNGQSDDLKRRRRVLGLSLVGALMAKIVLLYQAGIVKRLPDPPIAMFDSDRVDASDYAYRHLRTPDGVTMLINYGVTAWLAAADGENRARTTPLLPIAMATKTIFDSILALALARTEWKENKALCVYCQIATVASLASVGYALPEARKAVAALRKHSQADPLPGVAQVRELAERAVGT